VRGVWVVRHGEHAVAVRVQRPEIRRAWHGRVAAIRERIPTAVVGRPDHRGGRSGAVNGTRDLAEGGDVGGWLLAPRIPGTVHLVSKPHEDRHALAVVAGDAIGKL